MKKLAEITGKNNEAIVSPVCMGEQPVVGSDSDGSLQGQSEQSIPVSDDDVSESIENTMEAEFIASPELKELAMKWGADIGLSGALINNTITMTRKDYLKHTKSLTADQVLADPLLYIMFRSEEQADPNFFTWLDRFPKAKK